MENRAADVIRVLIVDDHPVVRDGVRAVLAGAPDMVLVGEASSGAEAETLVAELRPNILILDLKLPDRRPYEVDRWVRIHYPDTITLILTAHDCSYLLSQGVEAQVAGFLTKEQPSHHLLGAIRGAARGECLLTADQYRRAQRWKSEVGVRYEKLSEQERAVLERVGRGLDNSGIARELDISLNTVRAHLRGIYHKLGVSNRAEAVTFAHQLETA